nr:DNA polymerase IV [Candidatus Levybacteria bacterium]
MPIQKIILHIDFDSFFASCEQQFNPLLRDKPIGVIAQNGRTCIIAASRQAKKLGIKPPSRTFEALKIVPDMIFVPASFQKYWQITQKFLNICKDYSPYVELFSLDEVFMDITQTESLFGGKYQLIEKIKERIRIEIGEYVTVSVGVSYNKLLAKLGSGMNKPNGIFEITPQNLDQVYQKTKLTDICGIGERMALRLNKLEIYTLLQLRNYDNNILRIEFGNAYFQFLKNTSIGKDGSAVIPYYEIQKIKSISRSYCLPKNEYDKRIILQNLYELCEEVSIKLRRLDKKARTVSFYLSGSIKIQKRKTYAFYFDTGKEIFKHCLDLMREEDFTNNYIRQINIWTANFATKNNLQMSLFDTPKNEKLIKIVDTINNRFGDHTIRNGFLLHADKLTTVPNGYMADRYEREKLSKSLN